MSEKYKIRNPDGTYFTTLTVVYWIDLFERPEFKHVIINALKFYQFKKQLMIHAWCLMSSHLHLMVSSNGQYKLNDILRDFKKYTNREIINTIYIINESRKDWLLNAFSTAGKDLKRIKNYKIWMDGSHPIELLTNKFFDQKLEYIRNNPVKAEIVVEPHHYQYSSAGDYAGIKGLLKIDFIE